jgi:hypothetical protein
MMTIYNTGDSYKLYISNVDPEGRIHMGIKCNKSFASQTNYIAVLIDKSTLENIIKDLQRRLSEM